MITFSRASQFVKVYERFRGQALALSAIDPLSRVTTVSQKMQPKMHPVTLGDVTHLYQLRASCCCRYYLLLTGSLCASCPLVSHEERILRNAAWMEKQPLKPPADIWVLTAT
jgi:hypothetical protein